jgi:hypothetical protein
MNTVKIALVIDSALLPLELDKAATTITKLDYPDCTHICTFLTEIISAAH